MLEYSAMSPGDFGLEDPEVIEVASQLAPELFAALVIAGRLGSSTFPLTGNADLERALRAAVDEDVFDAPGVKITTADVHERFPSDFLPVEDKLDLIRKVYMSIVIAHTTAAHAKLHAVRRGEERIECSHPLDLEALL
jgi:hypothetical protein